jgi:hypothetical protein
MADRDRNRVNRGEVASADSMRDGDTTKGTVTETYAATPQQTTTVRQEAPMVQRQSPPRDYSGGSTGEVEIPESYNLTRDRVRWGPIIAGFLTALTSILLLSLLGAAIGLTALNAGEAVAQGSAPSPIPGLIWGALTAILSFLLGGWVAGRTAAIFDRGWGALNGALVFLLAVPFTLWLAAQGLGALLGSLGSFAQGLNVDPNQARDAAQQAAGQAQAQSQVTPEQASQAAQNARNGAWGTLLGLLLGLGSSALGGSLGTRRKLEVDPQGRQVRE